MVQNKSQKKKKKEKIIREALYKVTLTVHLIKCISGQSLSHKKEGTKQISFPPNRECVCSETYFDTQNRLKGKFTF